MEASLSNKAMLADAAKYAAIFFMFQLMVEYLGESFVVIDTKTTYTIFLVLSIYAYHTFVAPRLAEVI